MAEAIRWDAPIAGEFAVPGGKATYNVYKLDVVLTGELTVGGRPIRSVQTVRESDAGGWYVANPVDGTPPSVVDVTTGTTLIRSRPVDEKWPHKAWYPELHVKRAVKAVRDGWAAYARANPEVVRQIWRQWTAYRLVQPLARVAFLTDLLDRTRREVALLERMRDSVDPRQTARELAAEWKELYPDSI